MYLTNWFSLNIIKLTDIIHGQLTKFIIHFILIDRFIINVYIFLERDLFFRLLSL